MASVVVESTPPLKRTTARFIGHRGPSFLREQSYPDIRRARRARFHEIVQNAVRDRFIERALAPIRCKIKLERLAFDAETIRHVIDVDPGEVGLAGYWTNRCEIIGFKMNPIISSRRIWESFQSRFRW